MKKSLKECLDSFRKAPICLFVGYVAVAWGPFALGAVAIFKYCDYISIHGLGGWGDKVWRGALFVIVVAVIISFARSCVQGRKVLGSLQSLVGIILFLMYLVCTSLALNFYWDRKSAEERKGESTVSYVSNGASQSSCDQSEDKRDAAMSEWEKKMRDDMMPTNAMRHVFAQRLS